MDYSSLKANIASWLNRSDLSSEIDTFIDLAEADMMRKLRHWRMEARTTLSVSGQYTDLPADFIEAQRVVASASAPVRMELMARGEMQQLREAANDTGGTPQYYAITGGQLEVYPSPDATYSVDLAYLQRPADLDDTDTTNWVITYYPDVYLYGALVHSAPFLMDDPRLAVWQGLYEKALAEANFESDRARYGGASPRMKIRSY